MDADRELEAGRELDALIAEQVMGLALDWRGTCRRRATIGGYNADMSIWRIWAEGLLLFVAPWLGLAALGAWVWHSSDVTLLGLILAGCFLGLFVWAWGIVLLLTDLRR